MAHRQKIPFKTDVLVQFDFPTDVAADTVKDATSGATCSFKVFDADKDEVISIDEATGQTVLSVTNAAVFNIGDIVEVTQNGGIVITLTALTAVDATNNTITSATSLAVDADAGARVRRKVGSITQTTMTGFGTSGLGEREWGFRGTLANDFAGSKLDLKIDVEISYIGAEAGGLDALDVQCGIIKPFSECSV